MQGMPIVSTTAPLPLPKGEDYDRSKLAAMFEKLTGFQIDINENIKISGYMQTKKDRIIKFRSDSDLYTLITGKADAWFSGNVSAFIRCALVRYTEVPDVPVTKVSEYSALQVGLLNSIDRQLRRIGVNINQIVKNINEKMKLSPRAFLSADLLPFSQCAEEFQKVEEMITELRKQREDDSEQA